MSGAPDPEIDPASVVARSLGGRTLAAVGAGGALGGVARYLLATAAPPGHGLPWATLAVNIAGAFVVGVLATRIAAGRLDERVRPFAVTGVCGGLTTFSTVMTEVHLLARAGRSGLAGAYLGLTLASGLAAAAVGARLAGER